MSLLLNTHTDCFCLSDDATPLTQRMIEALGQLQAQSGNNFVPTSFYLYDQAEQQVLCASVSVAAMLGYSADEIHMMGPIGLADLIHAEDLIQVAEHYERLETLCAGEVIGIEYRMKRADGEWCWLRSQATLLTQGVDDSPLQILGILQLMPQPVTTPVHHWDRLISMIREDRPEHSDTTFKQFQRVSPE